MLDTVGLAASLYRRGVPCVKIPTTLTAAVDAAIGVKNAVDLNGRKNLIGTYQSPAAVVIQPEILSSLPRRHIRAGLAEIIKVAIAVDASLFSLVEQNIDTVIKTRFQHRAGTEIVKQSIVSLAAEIWKDPYELDLDRTMDLGHSISKVLEERLRPRPTHGEAVALDTCLFLQVAYERGLLSLHDLKRCLAIFRCAGLPIVRTDINSRIIDDALRDTQTHRDGSCRCPLPGPIGSTTFQPVDTKSVLHAHASLLRWDQQI